MHPFRVSVLAVLAIAGVALAVQIGSGAPARAAGEAPAFSVLPRAAEATGDVAVPPLSEVKAGTAAGLVCTFEHVASKATDVTVARMPAIYVPAGSSATPFLPPGAFKAVWTGTLNLRLRGEHTFTAGGNGTLKITVNDAVVLEASGADLSTVTSKPTRLNKGPNKFTVEYSSPAEGDARLRVYWAGEDFPKEPLMPARLGYDVTQAPLREHQRLRLGRELFAELRCVRCHSAPGVPLPGAVKAAETTLTAMPELDMDAPALSDAGARLKQEWIAAWLKNPRALRPESSMPQVLHGATAAKDALDIAGYLASLGKADAAAADAPDEKEITAGGGLVYNLGCVGCHTMPQNPAVVEGRVPLRYVRSKYTPASLAAFLKQPDAHYKAIRMPNFRFSDKEIAQLSAFLLHSKIEDDTWLVGKTEGTADVARGKQLVETTGCLNCHALTGSASTLKAPELKLGGTLADAWGKGCMGADDAARGKAPNFSLSAEQRGALLAFAAHKGAVPSMNTDSMAEYAERQIAVLRCNACHQRDDHDDLWSQLEEEVAALKVEGVPEEHAEPAADGGAIAEPHLVEQVRPRLTWAGEKMKPEWMADFIAGKTPYKVRPWLHSRMPGFTQRAELIAKGMAIQHGVPPVSPKDAPQNAELAEAGKTLVGKNGGFSCTQCHGIGKAAAVGVFEAPGPNLMHVQSRLTQPYFIRWMLDPLRVESGTKMPAFATEGKTQLTDHFDGDATKQFEAIWHYLLAGDDVVAPEE